MIIRHSPPICDECSNEVAESLHAILGGKAYRLCGEACRSSCRARYLELRPHAASASGEASILNLWDLKRIRPCTGRINSP